MSRTACSSALTCLDTAVKAVQSGDIPAAIVGGSNLILAPHTTEALTEQGVLSPEGSCRTFDAGANGYGRAEGAGTLFIKRLDDALRDGNPVRAVIRASAASFDGKTPGLSLPSAEAHEALMRKCYDAAGISDPCDTGFVECHGTGTQAGDPVETTAVANVFGQRGVYIGSIKVRSIIQ